MDVMLTAILAIVILATLFGIILGAAAIIFKIKGDPTAQKIEAVLPQTQCGQCGYPGCKPYADAVAKNEAPANLCVPGGQDTINQISDIMGVEPVAASTQAPEATIAYINEDMCIGCTKCINACPVDAIVGSNRQIHTIIRDECTGCKLCVDPCPTECITMIPIPPTTESWKWDLPSSPSPLASKKKEK